MNTAIDRFAQVLASTPDVLLSINSIGAKKPANGSEIPAISVSLRIDDEKGLGYRRFVREGNVIAKNTALVAVRSTTEGFLPGFRVLRISPLPLKKNPDAVSLGFSDEDVQIRNITALDHPVSYRMVENPIEKDEFRLERPAAEIVFGEGQKEGDQLEIIHYTVTWRDEILGERYNGMLITELWSQDFAEANRICRKLQEKLRLNAELLRQKGYLRLHLASLDPVEQLMHSPAVGSSFPVFRQKLEYRFSFEAHEGGELSSGGVIKQINVDMDDHLREAFSVPRSSRTSNG